MISTRRRPPNGAVGGVLGGVSFDGLQHPLLGWSPGPDNPAAVPDAGAAARLALAISAPTDSHHRIGVDRIPNLAVSEGHPVNIP